MVLRKSWCYLSDFLVGCKQELSVFTSESRSNVGVLVVPTSYCRVLEIDWCGLWFDQVALRTSLT